MDEVLATRYLRNAYSGFTEDSKRAYEKHPNTVGSYIDKINKLNRPDKCNACNKYDFGIDKICGFDIVNLVQFKICYWGNP